MKYPLVEDVLTILLFIYLIHTYPLEALAQVEWAPIMEKQDLDPLVITKAY
jgi:hypothetical protein